MPLLATNVGGIPEIVNGTDTPLMPPGDVDVLARAMQGFLSAPEEAKARASRLKAAVADRFTVERAGRRGAGVLCRAPRPLTLTEKLTADSAPLPRPVARSLRS